MAGIAGRSGRSRLPTVVKFTRGTLRPGRQRANEPQPPPGVPSPPTWLPTPAEPHFTRLAELAGRLGVLSTLDSEAVALAAVALEEFLDADAAVRNAGSTVLTRETRYGTSTYAHPSVAIRSDAWRRLRDALRDLGLNPVARSTVDVLQPPAEPDPAERYFRS